MSALRFAMVTTFYPPHHFGGDAIAVQRLARGLVRRGHRVTVVHDAGAHRMLGGRPAAATPEPDGLETVALTGSLGPFVAHQTGRPLVHGARIRGVLDALRPDVVHFHNISLLGPGVLALGDGLKLLSVHDHWLVCPTHVLWRHGRERCEERQCLRCVLRHRRPPQAWRATGLLERQLEHVDTILAPSDFTRRQHAAFGLRRPMEVLPGFLEPEPASAGGEAGAGGDDAPHDRPYLLFVGRLEFIKGLQDVLPVVGREPDVDLVVAGTGTWEGSLRRLAEVVAPGRVRFLGRLDAPALRRWYRHAVALVAPSVCYETFGLVVIEALAEGTPVIARRLGAYPELVEDADAGLLFEDEAQLAEAIRRLRHEPGLRERHGRNGRRAVAERWSEGPVLDRYLALLRERARATGRAELADRLAAGLSAPDSR